MADEAAHAPLAALSGTVPPAPAWFRAAIACEPERSFVPVAGARIETLTWGERGRPGLLFLHGSGAHADLWRFLAPFFAGTHRVAALSWSGMGGSDWRADYALDGFAREAEAVAEHAGLFAGPVPPTAVAHSFGTMPLGTLAAGEAGERFARVVLVDPPIFSPAHEAERKTERPPPREPRPHRVYPDLAAALARFRFMPPQPCAHPFVADFVGRASLKRAPRSDAPPGDEDGWTWRFDPALWSRFRVADRSGFLPRLRCPAVLVRGERSRLLRPDDAAWLMSRLPAGTRFIAVPEADHQVMIDQPLAFVAMLRTLLAEDDA